MFDAGDHKRHPGIGALLENGIPAPAEGEVLPSCAGLRRSIGNGRTAGCRSPHPTAGLALPFPANGRNPRDDPDICACGAQLFGRRRFAFAASSGLIRWRSTSMPGHKLAAVMWAPSASKKTPSPQLGSNTLPPAPPLTATDWNAAIGAGGVEQGRRGVSVRFPGPWNSCRQLDAINNVCDTVKDRISASISRLFARSSGAPAPCAQIESVLLRASPRRCRVLAGLDDLPMQLATLIRDGNWMFGMGIPLSSTAVPVCIPAAVNGSPRLLIEIMLTCGSNSARNGKVQAVRATGVVTKRRRCAFSGRAARSQKRIAVIINVLLPRLLTPTTILGRFSKVRRPDCGRNGTIVAGKRGGPDISGRVFQDSLVVFEPRPSQGKLRRSMGGIRVTRGLLP